MCGVQVVLGHRPHAIELLQQVRLVSDAVHRERVQQNDGALEVETGTRLASGGVKMFIVAGYCGGLQTEQGMYPFFLASSSEIRFMLLLRYRHPAAWYFPPDFVTYTSP